MMKALQAQWKTILAFTGLIVSFLGALILPPPFFLGNKVSTEAARFAVALVIGLLLVPVAIYPARRKNVRRWVISAVLLAAAAFGALFLFWGAESNWIRYVGDRPFVIGSNRTPHAQAHIQSEARKGRVLTDEELILDYASDTERIWPRSEIAAHQIELLALYLVAIAASTATIVSVLQAGQSARKETIP